MPTAYLSPSQLQDLTNVSSTAPGSGDNGKALVWNNTAGKWQAEQVAYSNLSGAPALPIPVVSGGTGTQTGSITGTGALTFAAGGNNQNITVSPSGEDGFLVCTGRGFSVEKPGVSGFFKADGQFNQELNAYRPVFIAHANSTSASLSFRGLQATADNNGTSGVDNARGVVSFTAANYLNNAAISSTHTAFTFYNFNNQLIEIPGNGNLRVFSTTASTSTTTGALQLSGGAGIAGALHVGNPNASTAQLTVNGGNGGAAIIKLSRTVGATASYTWNLGGGRLSFTDDIANVTTLQTGTSGSTSIVVIGSDISSTSTSPGSPGLLKGSDAGGAAADITGGNLTIQSGRGRGAATPTSIFFNTPDVGSSGTTLQSVSTRLTVNHEGITAAGQIRSTATTASTSTITGALTVAGGAGIAGVINAGGLRIPTASDPTPTSAGETGEIRWGQNYIYVCTTGGAANNAVWKRAAISTWTS